MNSIIICSAKFLVEICVVESRKIRYGLQIFSDINPQEAKRFWFKELNISEDQFLSKIVVTQSGKIGTYRRKLPYGVLTLYCANIKLRKILDQLMQKYALQNF